MPERIVASMRPVSRAALQRLGFNEAAVNSPRKRHRVKLLLTRGISFNEAAVNSPRKEGFRPPLPAHTAASMRPR